MSSANALPLLKTRCVAECGNFGPCQLCVTVCYSVLQCVAGCCFATAGNEVRCSVLQCVAGCCVATAEDYFYCSVLQYGTMLGGGYD